MIWRKPVFNHLHAWVAFAPQYQVELFCSQGTLCCNSFMRTNWKTFRFFKSWSTRSTLNLIPHFLIQNKPIWLYKKPSWFKYDDLEIKLITLLDNNRFKAYFMISKQRNKFKETDSINSVQSSHFVGNPLYIYKNRTQHGWKLTTRFQPIAYIHLVGYFFWWNI